MAYLPNFDEDVFISYAHNDDDVYAQEPWGWVTRLHQDLEQRVRNYLGSDIRFWRDCEIRNNEDFTNKIFRRLAKTATLLSVLSPSFLQREWCRRELDAFTGNADSQARGVAPFSVCPCRPMSQLSPRNRGFLTAAV